MERNGIIFVVFGVSAALVGAFHTAYQLYMLVKLDAESRGMKHPKFWGVMAIGGNNSSGLLLYLIGRRNYPVVAMSAACREEMDRRKRWAGVGLLFLAVGTVVAAVAAILCAR